MDNFESMDDKQELIECSICSRSFNQKALERHIGICKKNSNKARKIFDASKQRAVENEGIPSLPSQKKSVPKPTSAKTKSTTNPAWKKKHEDFIATIRHARNVTALQAAGKPLPPSLPAAENPDYVKCPYCERRFNETAAQRHMPFCKEKQGRIPTQKVHTDTAKLRNKARVEYKAPRMRKAGDDNASMFSTRSGRSPSNRPQQQQRFNDNGIKSSPSPSTTSMTTRKTSFGINGTSANRQGSGEYNRKNSCQSRKPTTCGSTNNFCHDCGHRFEIKTAKFCCECGMKRLAISG